MSPDEYTTTNGEVETRQMVCSRCGGDFAGTERNVLVSGRPLHRVMALCDPCLKEVRK